MASVADSWLLFSCSHKAWKQSPPPPSESNKKVRSLLLRLLGGPVLVLQNQDCTWSTTTKSKESTESVTRPILEEFRWGVGNTDGTDLLGRKLKADEEFGRSKWWSILLIQNEELVFRILSKGMTKKNENLRNFVVFFNYWFLTSLR